MKIPNSLLPIIILAFFFSGLLSAQPEKKQPGKKGYAIEEFSHIDLENWESFGKGAMQANHGQTVIHETTGSVGYMLVSPRTYGENVIVSCDVMTLNPATVLVVEMAAHNRDNFELTLDPDYDGNVKYLFDNINMYMFAFHNAAHNKPGPFIRKYPEPGIEPIVEASKNVMQTGKYHHVEIGVQEGKLWFNIDGRKILKVIDSDYYKGGKVIIRIRGTAHETASCILKNLKIYSR